MKAREERCNRRSWRPDGSEDKGEVSGDNIPTGEETMMVVRLMRAAM